MTFDEELIHQRAYARMLLDMGIHTGPLDLVRVEYPDLPPRVSIIGGTIVRCAPDLWHAQGATVTLLETVK